MFSFNKQDTYFFLFGRKRLNPPTPVHSRSKLRKKNNMRHEVQLRPGLLYEYTHVFRGKTAFYIIRAVTSSPLKTLCFDTGTNTFQRAFAFQGQEVIHMHYFWRKL